MPIFPPGGLTSSVITTVWIGVAVVAFFNLRFGWVLSGLVVPGYLVPLLIAKPWAAVVILVESIVTYFVVWTFSEYLSRSGAWTSLFGRDRFFALILFSVAVRVVFDAWLLPEAGRWMNEEWSLVFDYRNNLHSFGLVIIALTANLFWKTGVLRGMVPLVVTVGLTYLIVRFGLMEFTNFTISGLGYMYEDIAASILASPKAYIVLLTVAFIASRMNLLYGWDFSGILIPSLLALQWYQPAKLLTSFAEAFLILLVARWLMQMSYLRNRNVEGARKLLLFFNIGFVYKIGLGFLMLSFFPTVKITDTYAFGYLLATLMAVKMHDKDIAARLTRATLQTSFVGVVVASLVGFGLTLVPWSGPWPRVEATAQGAAVERPADRKLADRIREDKILLYRAHQAGQMPLPLAPELDSFVQALDRLARYIDEQDDRQLQVAAEYLADIGYRIEVLEGRYLYLSEAVPTRGWGLFVVDTRAATRQLVEVPAPLDERGTLEAGVSLFVANGARALAIAGTKGSLNRDGSANVLRNRHTLFHVFHHSLARRDVVQVRAYTQETARLLAGIRRPPDAVGIREPMSSLWVKGELPPGLDLVDLRDAIGEFEVHWSGMPMPNRQRETVREGFAELVLNQTAARALRTRQFSRLPEPRSQVSDQRIDGYLQEWLIGDKAGIAVRGSGAYVPPRIDELLYLDEEVLTPLLEVANTGYRDNLWTDRGLEELRSIEHAAAAVGYQVVRYRHRRTQRDYIILHERKDATPRRFWGTYVFRLGPSRGYLVQVPRPLFEINSFEYAVSLFERLDARALLIAGADPGANLDGTADVVSLDNIASLFSLANQVILREAGDSPMLVIHSRARRYRPDVPLLTADVLLSVAGGTGSESLSTPLLSALVSKLEADGLTVEYVDGRPETAGYEVGDIPQSLYLEATENKAFCALWMSPLARVSYRQQDTERQEAARFRALAIETVEVDLFSMVMRDAVLAPGDGLPTELRGIIAHYLDTGDIVTLRRLQVKWPDLKWKRLIDRDSRQSFLGVYDGQDQLRLVVNLNPRGRDDAVILTLPRADAGAVSRFVDTRSAWLELRSDQ